MSSTSSKASRNRRSSILKVRQTTVDTTVDLVNEPKNRRRVSFHHQKTVKEYDKERHDLSATSPVKENVKEAMSDFDSTKSNSTMMSLSTPDRTAGDNTMNVFRGMLLGPPSFVHYETRDMSMSIIEDGQNDTLNMFEGAKTEHVSIHSKSVDISYRMEESMNETAADNTMDIFGKPSRNMSTRSTNNLTMDMDMSQEDTITEGAGDDTLAVFGSSSKKDSTINQDSTLTVFGQGSGSNDKSLVDQSILMEMSHVVTPTSSQDDLTMGVFGSGSQDDYSVAMEEATMNEGAVGALSSPLCLPTTLPSVSTAAPPTPLLSVQSTQNQSIMDISSSSAYRNESMLNSSKPAKEDSSPSMDDTMGVFGSGEEKETGDDDIPMDITQKSKSVSSQQSQLTSHNATINIMRRNSDDMDVTGRASSVSPTINIFKRKGEMGEEEAESENTMHAFSTKKAREDEDETRSAVVQGRDDGSLGVEDMEEVDETMNVFGMKANETLDESEMVDGEMTMKEEEKEQSIMELSMKTELDGGEEEKSVDKTFDVFNGDGHGEESEMDVSGEANDTFNGKTSNSFQMNVSGVDRTIGVYGVREEEREEEKEEEEAKKEVEDEEKEEENPTQKSMGDASMSIGEENGSGLMDESIPIPSQSPLNYEDRKKKRLSTLIEVSSRYTAASSQSMRQRVESTGEMEKDGGILDGMEMIVDEKEEKEEEEVEEMENEEKEEERVEVENVEGEKSMKMEESMANSPSPSTNNTTFSISFSKRSILDETRLSDRSMMNITRSFDEMMLENINWMNKEEEGDIEEMDQVVRDHANRMVDETRTDIEKSESTIEEHLGAIAEEHGDLLAASVNKLNPCKVNEMKQLFDWARREAQREWWEKRSEKANEVIEEMRGRMERDEKELEVAKEDIIMMNRRNELREDVDRLAGAVEVGRGMNRSTINELIGASKKKEEEKERLRKKVTKMEMDSVIQSTLALKMMTERCNDIDRSIRKKMEEREKNKKDLRTYLARMTNNLS